MVAPGGSAMVLPSLALLALLGTAAAFFPGLRRPSPLAFLESTGCVPANFSAELPATLTDAVASCSPRSRFGRSPAPFGRRSGSRFGRRGRSGGMTATLSCLAGALNITTDSGVDEAALDTVLESLSSNTTFTDQLKANADTCIAALNATLTTDQQGVYILSCLKLSQKADCALQNENATLCLNAKTLCMCPIGIKSLVDATTAASCKRQVATTAVSSMFSNIFSGGFSFSSLADSACSTMEENAKSVANCSLQAAGLASGGVVDLTAVQTAITSSGSTTDSEKALQQAVLDACQETDVDAFLDCWASESVTGCTTATAERLAAQSTTTTTRTTGFRGFGGFGGGRTGGSRTDSRRTGGSRFGGRRSGGRRGIFG